MKSRKKYKVKVFVKDAFGVIYSGGHRKFTVNGGLSKTEAIRTVKTMKMIYPNSYKYRIVRSRKKGLSPVGLILGIVCLGLCLAIANNSETIFGFAEPTAELVKMSFLGLGVGGLLLSFYFK